MKKFRLLLMLMCALLGFSQASAATESWGYYITGTSSGAPATLWKNLKNAVSADKAMDLELQGNMTNSVTTIGTSGKIAWKGYAIPNDKATTITTAADGNFKPSGLGSAASYAVQIGNNQKASTNYANPFVLSTDAFSGKTIKSVSVWAKSGAGATYTLSVTVGSSTASSTEGAITSKTTGATTVNVNASGTSLEIKIVPQSITSNANKSLVFCGLQVTYEDGSVTPSEPVDPKLQITNAERDETGRYYSQLVAINSTFTPEFSPAGLTITASGNDESIAKYENGVIKPVADGITTFTFTSAPVENTYLQGETKLELRVYTPTPVDPQLGVNNTLTEGKLVVMNGQEETLEFTPEGIKVNAPTGNDASIAVYENGNIVAKGVGTTTFHFTSDAVEYKYTAGEFDLIVEVTEYTQPLTVTFDFTNNNYGLKRFNTSNSSNVNIDGYDDQGYINDGTVITNDDVSLKLNGTKFRLWGDNAGASNADMRVYSNAKFVITAPKGYIFESMKFTGVNKWSIGAEGQGSYTSPNWTAGDAELSEVEFSYTDSGSGKWTKLEVTLKEAPKPVPAIVVSYQGDPMGENDHFTLVKDSELEVLVENAEAAKVTYYILDENVQGATAESGVVENNKFVLDKVGKFRIDFVATDASNTVLASKTVYVIVKGETGDITSTTYTLDFVNNTYGMNLNPATGSQVGENNNFTGTNTSGLVFFIPKGTNPVSLVNTNDGQELKMAQGGEFRVNINNYGQKIAKVEITGSNLEVLAISSNYDSAAEGVMTDGKLVYNPGTDVIARDFVVKYPATRAAGDPVYIKGINVTTAVDTAVEAIDAETAEPVYYDLQGNRVVNPERGIYIKVVGTKATKVLL